MHVACDAAESHHHILSYLKIDLPAFVCVCALVLRHRPGLFVAVYSRSHFPSHAALTLCSRNGANTRIHVLLSLSLCHTHSLLLPLLYISSTHCHAHMDTRTGLRTDPRKGGYASGHILQMNRSLSMQCKHMISALL